MVLHFNTVLQRKAVGKDSSTPLSVNKICKKDLQRTVTDGGKRCNYLHLNGIPTTEVVGNFRWYPSAYCAYAFSDIPSQFVTDYQPILLFI